MVCGKRKNKDFIKNICKPFILSDEQLKEIWVRMYLSVKQSLKKETYDMSDVKCSITYVHNLPTGNEKGKFLALDLCGPEFRIILLNIKSEEDVNIKSKYFTTPYKILMGPGVNLFNFIIECLISFTKENYVSDEKLPLGFTFPYPIVQLGLRKAILVTWNKGFRCSGVVGEDVVRLFKEALDRRREAKMIFCGILNDITGTLAMGAYQYYNCKIACNVGSSIHSCYIEYIEKCENYIDVPGKKYEKVVINTNWGTFGANNQLDFIKTKQDKEIDMCSENPGLYIFEKMTSALYLGELVRLIVVKCIKVGIMFNGRGSQLLFTKGSFLTKYIYQIEQSTCIDNICFQILADLDICHASDDDCKNLRYICEVVSSRSAQLIAAGIAALLNKLSERNITIAVSGSICVFHPRYLYLLASKIRQLIYRGLYFKLMISSDGSGKGSALIAASEFYHI